MIGYTVSRVEYAKRLSSDDHCFLNVQPQRLPGSPCLYRADLFFWSFIEPDAHTSGKFLKELLNGYFEGSHNQASSRLFNQGRTFLGSIKDPWEWYLSLWAYGCDSKGAVYLSITNELESERKTLNTKNNVYAEIPAHQTSRGIRLEQWQAAYRDVDDAGAFRAWLHLVNDATIQSDDLSAFAQLSEFEKKYSFINRFIRNESLEADIFQILEDHSICITAEKKTEILGRERSSTSSRKGQLADFYDRESENHVAERERLIIEKFAYAPPSSKSDKRKP